MQNMKNFILIAISMVTGFLVISGVMISMALQGNMEWWMVGVVIGAVLLGDVCVLGVLALKRLRG